jgi:Domain of unknown function (DUF6456)
MFAKVNDGFIQAAGVRNKAGVCRTGVLTPAGPVALPSWLPGAVRLYLEHTEQGLSLRALARREGCHASTVMRLVRRYENRRDDPLVDEALASMGRATPATRVKPFEMESPDMSAPIRIPGLPVDEATILREAPRLLRRLAEPGAILAIAADMDRAVILRAGAGDQMVQTAVTDRSLAQAFALKDWIACRRTGRITSYTLTAAGRMALKRMTEGQGFAEEAIPFADQHREAREGDDDARRPRYNAAESPVAVLARRRDKDGRVFLEPDLVAAAERLREDFELAQIGPRVTQNWERFLTGGDRGGFRSDSGPAAGPASARDRVAIALRDLGPGLGDVALRCCCYLEGLETAEQRMGWAARSGKIVLRIALQRLRRHYDETYGRAGPLIG